MSKLSTTEFIRAAKPDTSIETLVEKATKLGIPAYTA